MNSASPQRTRLAWRRTVLAAGVVALLAGRLAVHRGQIWLAAPPLLVWTVIEVIAQRRVPRITRSPGAALAGLALAVIGLAGIAIALVVLP